MRNQIIRPLFLLILPLLMLSGCVTTWTRVEQGQNQQLDTNRSFSVVIPTQWVRLTNTMNNISVTRDGTMLQWIEVKRRNKEKPFASLDKALPSQPLVTELAEYYLADTKKQAANIHIEQLDLQPVSIAEQTGFRMTLKLVNSRGLEVHMITYGVWVEGWFYQLSYQAPKLYYFERDLPAFEQIVGTFTLRP